MEQVANLAKTLFRDSAELPMDVQVTTTVRKPGGAIKQEHHATVHMRFHGYNRTGRFTVSAKGNVLDRRATLESMSGDLAAFAAGTLLLTKRDNASVEVEKQREPGTAFVVKVGDRDCGEFALVGERILFPTQRSFCGKASFELSSDAAGALTFRNFHFSGGNLPAGAKTAELGNVRILSFGIDEEFQNWTWPGDVKPFLLPRSVHIVVATDKGQIEITNQYTPGSLKQGAGCEITAGCFQN
jgi:hypothetical protein